MSIPETLPVAILAGGLATRLRPITERIPKALVEVAGEPFLFHQLRYLAAQRVRRVVICTGYLGEQIESAVGTGSAFGLEIQVSPDGEKLLGTGGAIKRAAPMLGENFFVLYGDSYLLCDFGNVEAAFRHSGKLGLMTVLRNEDRWDKSNVLFVAGELVAYSKRDRNAEMRHIDYGLSVLRGSSLDRIPPDQPYDLADLFAYLSKERLLAGFEVHDRFYEIGSHQGLREAEAYLLNRGLNANRHEGNPE